MKVAIILLTFLLLAGACRQQADDGKQPLKVLFVGNDPAKEIPVQNFINGAGIAEKRYAEDMKTRMPAFMEFLKQHFTRVDGVDVSDYKEEMTGDYDVVIFDAVPKPLVPGVKTPQKRSFDINSLPEEKRKKLLAVVDTKEVMSARYFSDHYDKPTILLGDKAGVLGAAIGLKLNWFCRCLDAHAFDLNTEHPIFHSPLPVELSYESRLAPKAAIGGAEGVTTPGVMPMWRVQTEGYREGGRERYRQGLVAFGDGFEDSPDAERMAGGVSDKGRNAVSIGRHGNFLMWGFAASPDYMTEPAQKALVNAICYISGFNGQIPVARKYKNGWVTREKMQAKLDLFRDETYAAYVKNTREYNDKLTAMKQEVESLKEAGENIPADLVAQAWPGVRPVLDREALLKSCLEFEAKKAGCKDMEDYRKYLAENMDYFYGGEGDFSFSVDEDLKHLGIPMGDVKVLDRAVELLQGPAAGQEMGKRLLQRYTGKDFATAAEWKNWLASVRGQLFFSESCGYKFLENSGQASVPAQPVADQSGVMQESPVEVTAKVLENEIIVTCIIKPGFHIYAASGDAGAYTLTRVDFTYPQGIRAKGALISPEGKVYDADPKVRIYEGMVEFRQPLTVEKEGKVTCTVTYQACDATICLPPVTEEREVEAKG